MLRLSLCIALLLETGLSVDRGNFKTCDQSSFCKRQRATQPHQSPYVIVTESFSLGPKSATFKLLNTDNNVALNVELFALRDNTLRLKANEAAPIKPRFEPPIGDVLVNEPKTQSLTLVERSQQKVTLSFQNTKLIIENSPFRIDIITDNELVMSVNARGLLNFEHYRQRKLKHVDEPANDEAKADGTENDDKKLEDVKGNVGNDDNDDNVAEDEGDGMWEETFRSHSDSKINGPSSVGLDFTFHGYEFVYGIPEHADSLALKTTNGGDPYRLYNLDVFEYELNNPMALYGSVPVMYAHSEKRTVGLFWLNVAETWIDITSNTANKNMFSKLVDFVKGDTDIAQVETHWFSESGIIDVFMMLGPKPADVFAQYAALTGATPLPPLFAIAYHQSRWNYNDEQDVANVDAGYDEHDIPLDVIWLDIEHSDGKRYFTWDQHKFPDPEQMLKNVSAKGRKMVTAIDPHVKRDDGFFLYQEANSHDGYFVKNKDGVTYDGWCWPGSSAWLDFVNPAVQDFWASKFLLENYKGSTLDLFTWNDMNEPSVFNGPEITMHKDAKHYGGWEHRDVHNIYGLYVHRSSATGQILRSGQKQRPFVLSRAFFSGSQRYGAVWTGDNTGEWSHLRISLPMLLSLNLVGITFSGADVGGFFKNPDEELLTRWYQAAAFQPFFRAHAHLDTKRREPWLLAPQYMHAIRLAIRIRYRLLPYWYTLFYNSEKSGAPIMRPLWVDFPSEKATFKIEDEHLVGSAILVRPVTDMGAVGVNVYLPGPDQVWYSAENYLSYKGGNTAYLPVDLNKIPMFYRGGFIIPVRERIRRASILSAEDPYTLIVALNSSGEARGDLYHDDFHSFQYKLGEFVHRQFVFTGRQLTSSNLNPIGRFETEAWLERIVIVGLTSRPHKIILTSPGLSAPVYLDSTYKPDAKLLTIRRPAIKITSDFQIALNA
jgi:alpha 1,3-glucosidase